MGVRHPPKRAICVHLSWVPCCQLVHSRVPIRDGDAHAIPEVGEGATLGPAYYYVSRYRPLGVSPACRHHQPRCRVSTQERIWVGATLVNAAVLLVLSLDPDALLCAGRDPPEVGDLHHPEGRDRWSGLRIAGPCRCVPLLLTSVTSTQMTPNVGSGEGGHQLTAPTRAAAIWLPLSQKTVVTSGTWIASVWVTWADLGRCCRAVCCC